MKSSKNKAPRATPDTAERFEQVVSALSKKPDVTTGRSKGFGSGALKVNGRIFAMISSKGAFVVKLPQERVVELVKSGDGEPFDTGKGRRMKEWLEVRDDTADWVSLATEALRFVRAVR